MDKHSKYFISQNSGFTLVETLLYIAMAGSILMTVYALQTLVQAGQAKQRSIAEVEQQGVSAMQTITQALKNARMVTEPVPNLDGNQLSLTSPLFADNPVVFHVKDGTLTQTIGSTEGRNLTASNITVSRLVFTNLSRPGTPDLIRIELTLRDKSGSASNEYSYEASFYDSVSLRK